MECSNCGVSGSKERIVDVLSSKGIVKVCDDCSRNESMPIMRRPTTFQLKESEKKESLYLRLSKTAGINHEESKQKTVEANLKSIVNRNFEKTIPSEVKKRPDLVDNFHWVIMRARRMKKLTHGKFAKEISESEAAVKMAERGILPDDDYRLINKFESFLGIKLIKDNIKKFQDKQPARIIKFDKSIINNLTISDLKKIKDEKESNIVSKGFEVYNGDDEETH